MHMNFSRPALILFVAIGAPNASLSADMCQILSGLFVTEATQRPTPQDYSDYSVQAFRSVKLDACIHVERNKENGAVQVFDLTRSEIPDSQSKWGILLLNCDPQGVAPATIHKVTDGQEPNVPYTRQDCDRVLEQWLTDWR